MKKVKISVNSDISTLNRDQNDFTCLSKFLPLGGDVIGDCRFFVNQHVENPDYWLVIDDVCGLKDSAIIEKDRVFFLTAEVPFVTNYFDDKKFLSQFAKIVSCHAIFNHDNVQSDLPFLSFMINAVYGKDVNEYDDEFNYDKMLEKNFYEKTRNISIIASHKGSVDGKMTEFHKIRYHFANKLKDHFKDKIDFYGYGHNQIETKAQAILPYKYHICLENQTTANSITEKLYDSYLGLAYPIYWGCSNVTDYFSENSVTQINIFDFKGTVDKIQEVIESNLFEKNFDELVKAKNDVLNKYGVFQRIAKICQDDFAQNNQNLQKEQITICNRKSFKKNDKLKKLITKIKNKL